MRAVAPPPSRGLYSCVDDCKEGFEGVLVCCEDGESCVSYSSTNSLGVYLRISSSQRHKPDRELWYVEYIGLHCIYKPSYVASCQFVYCAVSQHRTSVR